MSVSYFRKQAKEMLYRDWIMHIGAFLTVFATSCALFTAALSVTFLAAQYTSSLVYPFVLSSALVFIVSLCVPLYYGLFVFEYNVVNTHKPDIKDVFYAFSSSQRYKRSFLTAFAIIWRFLVCFFVPLLFLSEIFLYTQGQSKYFIQIAVAGYDITYTYLCVLFVTSFIIAFSYFSRYFTAIYVVIEHENQPVSKCFFAAKIYNRKYISTFILLTFSYIPLAIFSVFTFGILFIIYTLPVMVIAYLCISSYVCCDTKAKEMVSDVIFETTQND